MSTMLLKLENILHWILLNKYYENVKNFFEKFILGIIETATALKILDSHLSRHTELFDLKALTYVHKKNRIIIDKKWINSVAITFLWRTFGT